MRYEIINGKIKDSIWIDAPYDSKKDALDDLNSGIEHNCIYCMPEIKCVKLLTEMELA